MMKISLVLVLCIISVAIILPCVKSQEKVSFTPSALKEESVDSLGSLFVPKKERICRKYLVNFLKLVCVAGPFSRFGNDLFSFYSLSYN